MPLSGMPSIPRAAANAYPPPPPLPSPPLRRDLHPRPPLASKPDQPPRAAAPAHATRQPRENPPLLPRLSHRRRHSRVRAFQLSPSVAPRGPALDLPRARRGKLSFRATDAPRTPAARAQPREPRRGGGGWESFAFNCDSPSGGERAPDAPGAPNEPKESTRFECSVPRRLHVSNARSDA